MVLAGVCDKCGQGYRPADREHLERNVVAKCCHHLICDECMALARHEHTGMAAWDCPICYPNS